MGLVHDEGVVGGQGRIPLGFGQQDAVGHDLDMGVSGGPVGKSDLIADEAPGRSPSSSAIRRATVVAAIRRGWVQPIIPWPPRPASRQNLGIWVVFPDPVSPETITTGCRRIALDDLVPIGHNGKIGIVGDFRNAFTPVS